MTWEPLSNIIADGPHSCAVYEKQFDLLNTPGWKQLKWHMRTAKRLIRTLKKSKYRQAKASRRCDHGWEVPRHYAHALQLDVQCGNNKWRDAIDLEIEQIKEYKIFKDHGKAVYEQGKVISAPKEYQKIRVCFVFDVKHSGKFKANHLTKEPNETVYSGVVFLQNLRLAMFLAELNGLQLWGADVRNANLQPLTEEQPALSLVLSLKNYKDMFLLCTRHSMVQGLEEHAGMTSFLIFFSRWISNLQEQTQTYG